MRGDYSYAGACIYIIAGNRIDKCFWDFWKKKSLTLTHPFYGIGVLYASCLVAVIVNPPQLPRPYKVVDDRPLHANDLADVIRGNFLATSFMFFQKN